MLNIKLNFYNTWSLVYIFLKVGPASCKMLFYSSIFFVGNYIYKAMVENWIL